jgi:hypothetical protein
VAVLVACSGGKHAYEDATHHGVLSYYVCKGLRGAADKDADGTVTWSELVPYVRDQVSVYAKMNLKANQTPVVVGTTREFRATVPK